jgi:hypothetical protein
MPFSPNALAARVRLWQDAAGYRRKVMRWILSLVALGAFTLAFSTKSPGLMGVFLVIGVAALFAAVFAFAADKIAATSRPDSALLTDKDIAALRASMRKPTPPTPQAPSHTEE